MKQTKTAVKIRRTETAAKIRPALPIHRMQVTRQIQAAKTAVRTAIIKRNRCLEL
jgi:hypothetical protein